jgi:hypothetical protein
MSKLAEAAMTKRDRSIILLLLVFSAISFLCVRIWLGGSRPAVLVVKTDGIVAYRSPVTKAILITEYTGPVGKSVVEVDGDRVHMLSSDCPDKVCVNMGWIRSPGQVIVCLPNRVVISLEDDR